RERLLAVYDFLAEWFTERDFRGCGFINAFGELGAASQRVAEAVREHKASFQRHVDRLVAEAGGPASLGPQLAILAEGAQTTAAISGNAEAAESAREAARTLIESALSARGARAPAPVGYRPGGRRPRPSGARSARWATGCRGTAPLPPG